MNASDFIAPEPGGRSDRNVRLKHFLARQGAGEPASDRGEEAATMLRVLDLIGERLDTGVLEGTEMAADRADVVDGCGVALPFR